MARVVKIEKKGSSTVVTVTENGDLHGVRMFNRNHNVFFDYLNKTATVTGCTPPLIITPQMLDPVEHPAMVDLAAVQAEFEANNFFVNTEQAP